MLPANLQIRRITKWEELFNKYSNIESSGEVFDGTRNAWGTESIEEDQQSLLPDDAEKFWEQEKDNFLHVNRNNTLGETLLESVRSEYSQTNASDKSHHEKCATFKIYRPDISKSCSSVYTHRARKLNQSTRALSVYKKKWIQWKYKFENCNRSVKVKCATDRPSCPLTSQFGSEVHCTCESDLNSSTEEDLLKRCDIALPGDTTVKDTLVLNQEPKRNSGLDHDILVANASTHRLSPVGESKSSQLEGTVLPRCAVLVERLKPVASPGAAGFGKKRLESPTKLPYTSFKAFPEKKYFRPESPRTSMRQNGKFSPSASSRSSRQVDIVRTVSPPRTPCTQKRQVEKVEKSLRLEPFPEKLHLQSPPTSAHQDSNFSSSASSRSSREVDIVMSPSPTPTPRTSKREIRTLQKNSRFEPSPEKRNFRPVSPQSSGCRNGKLRSPSSPRPSGRYENVRSPSVSPPPSPGTPKVQGKSLSDAPKTPSNTSQLGWGLLKFHLHHASPRTSRHDDENPTLPFDSSQILRTPKEHSRPLPSSLKTVRAVAEKPTGLPKSSVKKKYSGAEYQEKSELQPATPKYPHWDKRSEERSESPRSPTANRRCETTTLRHSSYAGFRRVTHLKESSTNSTGRKIILDSAILRKEARDKMARTSTKRISLFQI